MAAKADVHGSTAGLAHRIVVGIDGSENATAALEWATYQAQRFDAVLEIVTAFGSGHAFVAPSEVRRAPEQTSSSWVLDVVADSVVFCSVP